MNTEYFEEMHKLSHDDDRRYLMLMRGLRMMQEERKNSTLVQRLARKWGYRDKKPELKAWETGRGMPRINYSTQG